MNIMSNVTKSRKTKVRKLQNSKKTKCRKLQKVEKQFKHELLLRYKVRNLLTATCTVYEKFPWAFLL